MKLNAITLWRPWPFWVLWKWKTIETRTHDLFRELVGQDIAIHSAAKWDLSWIQAKTVRPFTEQEHKATVRTLDKVKPAVVAVVHVERFDPVLTHAHSRDAMIDCGSVIRSGLFLTLQRAVVPPFECAGQRGIFAVEIPDVSIVPIVEPDDDHKRMIVGMNQESGTRKKPGIKYRLALSCGHSKVIESLTKEAYRINIADFELCEQCQKTASK